MINSDLVRDNFNIEHKRISNNDFNDNNDIYNAGYINYVSTNITNNYIDAIDTKSFEDRILGSHNAVWAANQYANKSLPLSRGRA